MSQVSRFHFATIVTWTDGKSTIELEEVRLNVPIEPPDLRNQRRHGPKVNDELTYSELPEKIFLPSFMIVAVPIFIEASFLARTPFTDTTSPGFRRLFSSLHGRANSVDYLQCDRSFTLPSGCFTSTCV